MKKVFSLLLSVVLIFILASCGVLTPAVPTSDSSAPTSPSPSTASPSTSPESSDSEERGKILIVYFSWSPSGNTEKMANAIKDATGADILRIEPSVAYPSDYSVCGEVAKVERDENARPEIANLPASLAEYDTVFVGYPIWWHTAPMIVGTFLESFDLTGKQIFPFSQSSSMDTEQFENSMAFVRECAKGAVVHDGLFVRASDTSAIDAYLIENGFAK